MEKLAQEYFMRFSFGYAVDRETQLLNKYEYLYKALKDSHLKEMLMEFKETACEHIELLKTKQLKMNYE